MDQTQYKFPALHGYPSIFWQVCAFQKEYISSVLQGKRTQKRNNADVSFVSVVSSGWYLSGSQRVLQEPRASHNRTTSTFCV